MDNNNNYIVNSEGEVLAILTEEATYEILKSMFDNNANNEDKNPKLTEDKTEKIENIKLEYKLTPKGDLIVHLYQLINGEDETPLSKEELSLALDLIIEKEG